MTALAPQAKRREDYQASAFSITKTELIFHLDESKTQVQSRLSIHRQGSDSAAPLVLDGVDLTLLEVTVNGQIYTDYEVNDESLTLHGLPNKFELGIKTQVNPKANSSLEGLYLSAGAYCTQCEAEGFRKITYYLDRPDVLSVFTVTVHAQKDAFPYLLSNGNKVDSGTAENGQHWVKWHDPFKKPCYLFALVAGDFDLLEDSFITASGRKVALELYVDKGKLGRGQHALDSLKNAMKWDQDTFGLEYDLDVYMIVAVDFFNMGAMENKGLNVFNSKYVLADADSATDEDYFNIESVIAHEYFHNWTGNRVTCRDWFQLSLKEGLTVFRDQQFSSDMSDPLVNRIKQVRIIREHQFAEDAGPMSHPIRPDIVAEMNNFYTVTVYDKGAEVIRMMHTLLGESGFRKGMDLYFERHDGQAVTCDDFVQAMQDANAVDMALFKNWYSQSGTPVVKVDTEYLASEQAYQISFEQIHEATPDQTKKTNLHLPIQLEVFQTDNNQSQSIFADTIELTEKSKTLRFDNISRRPVAAVLGNFSAPVKLDFECSQSDLVDIVRYAKDDFSRWDASQTLYSREIKRLYTQLVSVTHDTTGVESPADDLAAIQKVFSSLLEESAHSPAICAEMLSLPSFETLLQQMNDVDVSALLQARKMLKTAIQTQLQDEIRDCYDQQKRQPYAYTQSDVNSRRLKNVCLGYFATNSDSLAVLESHFNASDNMTDTLGALKAAQNLDIALFDSMMMAFEQRWQHDALVLDKWFALHAGTERTDILSRLDLLQGHAQFDQQNPNRVRALIGSFAFYNPYGFHNSDGSGYQYLTNYLMELDKRNPQVASRLVTPLIQSQRLQKSSQDLINHQLLRLADKSDLSKDLREKVDKSLGG